MEKTTLSTGKESSRCSEANVSTSGFKRDLNNRPTPPVSTSWHGNETCFGLVKELVPVFQVCLLSSKGQINATRITAIAAGQDDSDIVEVRARVHPSQSQNFKCDILVNGKTYYFNYTEEKVQIFKSKL